jgi:phosphate transport system substrate-binding protein
VRISSRQLIAGAMAASLVLAACGGDDDSTTPATDAPTVTTAAGDTSPPMTGDTMAPMAPVSGTLNGAGASSQAAGMQGWQAGFQALNPDATVNYDAIGSGGGREQFLAGGSDFAGSDAYLKPEELTAAIDRCPGDKGAIDLPHYISPIAVAYNLPSLDGTTLNLSPAVLAGIFANTITKWNDPSIAADNPGVDLPDTTINPVHRSDESGTTKNFTEFLSAVAPDVWTYGAIEAWDADGPGGGEGGDGTSGVVATVGQGEGSVGYADASQIGELPAAAIGVGDEFVEYSAEAAAKIVDVSSPAPDRPEGDFAYDLQRDTTESGVYPIVLVSYHIVCLQYETQEQVDLVKAFMLYVGSAEGQAAAQASAGSAPITPELSAQLAAVVDTISVAG